MLGFPMFAQEVRFPPAIVSAGGSSNGSTANQSRWRLAPIHVITLKENLKTKGASVDQAFLEQDWNVSIYPNPVEDFLHLEFEIPEEKELFIKITDISGRVVFIQEAQPFVNGSSVELNFSRYIPALYLLQISSPDLKSQKVCRIQKL